MTPDEISHFEEFLTKAMQSGKKETSDLVADILHRMEPVIANSIETHVNGKIRNLTGLVEDHNKTVDAYIIEDTTWKNRAEPVVKAFENATWFTTSAIKVLKFIGLLGGAIGAYLLIKKLLE